MFRVYDTEDKCWIRDGVYLATNPHNDLYIAKKNFFGIEKLYLVSNDRYVIHKEIDLYDKNKISIYEGDYVKANVSDNREVVGMVAYAHELSAYVILCIKSDEYFTLGSDVCDLIEVIGNVFDGYKEEILDGQQAL